MIELKVQCDCGQKYRFDVEPINGLMPFRVNCPACGADGTVQANVLLQQMPPAPAPVTPPLSAPPLPIAPPPLPAQLRTAPTPVAAAAPTVVTGASRRPAAARSQAKKGNDGWEKSESDFNKLGSYVMLIPSILGAMLAADFFGVEVSPLILAVIVGICGVIGGAINIMGRGPIPAGMLVGLIMALGGFGAVYWWIRDRVTIYKFEVAIAFVIGAAPGYGLQFLFQKILLKRKQAVQASEAVPVEASKA